MHSSPRLLLPPPPHPSQNFYLTTLATFLWWFRVAESCLSNLKCGKWRFHDWNGRRNSHKYFDRDLICRFVHGIKVSWQLWTSRFLYSEAISESSRIFRPRLNRRKPETTFSRTWTAQVTKMFLSESQGAYHQVEPGGTVWQILVIWLERRLIYLNNLTHLFLLKV